MQPADLTSYKQKYVGEINSANPIKSVYSRSSFRASGVFAISHGFPKPAKP
jgi:hypothetical protein